MLSINMQVHIWFRWTPGGVHLNFVEQCKVLKQGVNVKMGNHIGFPCCLRSSLRCSAFSGIW